MVTMESSGGGAYKKATAALDEAARARLRGPFITGDVAPSPAPPSRRADADDDLMDLVVDEFYNGYGERGTDGDFAKDAVARRRTNEWKETLRLTLVNVAADAAAARIRAEAERVVREAGPAIVGLCRSSWEKTSSVPAPGSYEYADVRMVGSSPLVPSSRYIVEVNVAGEFEIARPSAEYQELLSSLPLVLVARPEALKELAAAMCAAAEESIRRAGMHVPPWRRAPYVQAKWSGQFERVSEVAGGAGGAAAHARRRKNCGMEMGRREAAAMGREALVSARPLFR
nr:unnamed protein product [Digitaria exilis]